MARAPRSQKSELHLFQLAPNLLTLAAICAGLTAIRFAFQGQIEFAVALIVLAGVLDGLDGRLARALKSESELGAELDSLADFLNFGVAPALTLYAWTLGEPRGAGWIAVLIYAICCVMRLARFNVGIKSAEGGDKRFFTGVPAPAGALLVLFPVFAAKAVEDWPVIPREAISFYMIVVGGLMISRLPTMSLKAVKINTEHARYVLVAVVAALAALVTYPWVTLFVADVAYMLGLIVAFFQWRRNRRAPKP
ncbi:CDP-diacylglycerol--serine O-phosphatidyltransferase [Defluviimonas sp. WL0075]|uniref:CDP-diacylglycerol--serine O-phosphatidyltransferase n=1 Tax=Albidovulum sediminicola TaxID=2984331 RepID=A0ABT2Z722_9RHOB|nr:CDP-diacylglycerol--serine O-phosphatidyltransferase [Defluviimonas sp. WL0075]MCV2866934.1 CDP-diacylglycerol--serine O-phosphatidyltransferase [Defluviimonas sp. WL0075]